jgi:hypothetical protein
MSYKTVRCGKSTANEMQTIQNKLEVTVGPDPSRHEVVVRNDNQQIMCDVSKV